MMAAQDFTRVRSRQLIIFQPKIYEAINWNYISKSRCCFEDKECEIYNMDYEDDTNSNNTTNNINLWSLFGGELGALKKKKNRRKRQLNI